MIEMAVNGAAGRMGRRVVALIAADPVCRLVAALESAGHPSLGQDAGRVAGAADLGVPIAHDLAVTPEVLIDFSTPASLLARLDFLTGARVGVVVGTTGFSDSEREQVLAASHQTAVLVEPNMSVGVNLLYDVATRVAAALGPDFDLEIVETHHRHKADAPSGTALALARRICQATGRDFKETVIFGRSGRTGERPAGQIAIHAIRAGEVVGEHTLIFSGLGERLELTHVAHTRDAFALGAVRAGKFIARKGPGLYTMADVLAEPAPTE